MNYKEITDLIKTISKSNLSEFKYRNTDFEITIRTENYSKQGSANKAGAPMMPMSAASPVQHIISTPAPVSAPPAAAPPAAPAPATTPAPAASEEEDSNSNLIEIKSPIVGTFYRSASPEKPPYAKVGDSINVGDVVCIVEAMKLFNEIESEVSGKIVKVVVEDASPVEYDQVLYLVDPNA
jgi:acetyl-CoA carboxylase biotin carboxyl carrier protein